MVGESPLAHSKGPGQRLAGGLKTLDLYRISTEHSVRGRLNVAASTVTDLRQRRIERLASELARQLISKTYLIVEIDELDSVDEWRAAARLAARQRGWQVRLAGADRVRHGRAERLRHPSRRRSRAALVWPILISSLYPEARFWVRVMRPTVAWSGASREVAMGWCTMCASGDRRADAR